MTQQAKILAVDLDHTLIHTDLLYESTKIALKRNPLTVFMLPFWLIQGKGYLKNELIKRADISVSTLPYNDIVINYIKQRKKANDTIILATASHHYYALKVAEHLNLFDDVMATEQHFNLSSHNKADRLVRRFGHKNFDYIGDHLRDIPVWQVANLAVLVNASKRVLRKTKNLNRLVLSEKN